jgi:hypothetical protein
VVDIPTDYSVRLQQRRHCVAIVRRRDPVVSERANTVEPTMENSFFVGSERGCRGACIELVGRARSFSSRSSIHIAFPSSVSAESSSEEGKAAITYSVSSNESADNGSSADDMETTMLSI